MNSLSALPALNAALNGVSALLLLTGSYFIRHRNVLAHKTCMLAAFGVSSLFLLSYLVYHFQAGSTPFSGPDWTRPVYFALLISHILLAASLVPLVIVTLHRGLKSRVDLHRRLARRTLPVWLYVSVTGVIIYLMLYHLFPPVRVAVLGN